MRNLPRGFSLEKKKDKSNPLYSVIDSVKNLFYYLRVISKELRI